MRQYEDSNQDYLSDYALCISYLLIAFSLLYLSAILLVVSFGWNNLDPEQLVTGLSYKFAVLLGWPKYVIAYVTFIWTMLCLSRMEYPLTRKGSWFKNVVYFGGLYAITLAISHFFITFVYYQIRIF